MSLKDRLRTTASQLSTFTCARYEPLGGSRRCRHYVEGGACARPDEFMCVEWLRANGHPVPPPLAAAPEPDAPANRDLFGVPIPAAEEPAPPAPPAPDAPAPRDDIPVVRNITDEEVASFKALRAEVCLRSEAVGEVWLVPEYTGASRKEIGVEHAVTLSTICAAFPGAKVVAFDRPAAESRPDDDAR